MTTWAQTFSFDGSAVSSRAFRAVPASTAGFVGNDEQELLDLRESNFDAAESSDFEAMSAVYTPKVARRRDLPGGGYAGLTGGGTISELDRETAEYCGDLRRRDE